MAKHKHDAPPAAGVAAPEAAPAAPAHREWVFAVANDFVRFDGRVRAATAEAAADQVRGWLTAGITVVAG